MGRFDLGQTVKSSGRPASLPAATQRHRAVSTEATLKVWIPSSS